MYCASSEIVREYLFVWDKRYWSGTDRFKQIKHVASLDSNLCTDRSALFKSHELGRRFYL